MHRSWKKIALPAAVAFALVAGCENMKKDSAGSKKMDASGKPTAVAHLETAKAASTQPAWGKPTGTVTFTQVGDNKVKAAYDIKGLAPGKHGFHIHDKGDLSAADFSSAGPHFNPTKHKHDGTTGDERHAGDLGNVDADTSGNAKGNVTVEGLTIGSGAATDIVGRSIVVHEKADDMKTDPSGNSGARIAAGVIESKK
ncbi:MAG: superoxide dismutase, Cu-Zn family [Phycisphaerales bacterium]|jgi:Cu-Zn family superoxide dismutase|nr:superoxide dismutase, Cu-Zn family [Phycisphaerales bacterium]